MAVRSGARSVLGTLWSVNDEATTLLISAFYDALASGPISRAEALQRAQRVLIQSAVHRHPGYWAPFLLISNWM